MIKCQLLRLRGLPGNNKAVVADEHVDVPVIAPVVEPGNVIEHSDKSKISRKTLDAWFVAWKKLKAAGGAWNDETKKLFPADAGKQINAGDLTQDNVKKTLVAAGCMTADGREHFPPCDAKKPNHKTFIEGCAAAFTVYDAGVDKSDAAWQRIAKAKNVFCTTVKVPYDREQLRAAVRYYAQDFDIQLPAGF